MNRTFTLRELAPADPSSSPPDEDHVWLLNLDNIEPHTGRLLGETRVAKEEVGSSTHAFDEGNVLYSKLRPYLNKVYLPHSRGLCTSELVPLRPDTSKVTREYLAAYLRSPKFLTWVNQQIDGAKMPRVSMKMFWEHSIDVPPLEEQNRIVAILDKADSLRRKRQQAIRLADDLLRAVFLDMFGDPVTNPKGWRVLPMGEVIEFKGGSQPPKETFRDDPLPGYVRLVQIRDFKTDKYKTYIPGKMAKRAFNEDDVMIARYGPPVFQILRGLSGSYNVALMKAQPKADILKEFIFWLLQLPAYHDVVVANSERTAGQTGVNLELLNKLLVPLPPVEVQEEIAARTKAISKMVEIQRIMIDELELQSKSIQSQFFS